MNGATDKGKNWFLRGGLFAKYVLALVGLVVFVLAVNGALETWMRANVEDFTGPVTVEQFKGGQSNPTFKLVTPTRNYVMRSKPGPAAKLLPSAHAVEREYRVLAALADTDVPVARVYGLCEDEALLYVGVSRAVSELIVVGPREFADRLGLVRD
jgi:hypothetical protein